MKNINFLPKNKKGIISMLLIAIYAVIAIILIAVLWGFAWFLSVNLVMFMGIALFVIGLIFMFQGQINQISIWLVIGGVLIVLLQKILNFSGVTLGAVLP